MLDGLGNFLTAFNRLAPAPLLAISLASGAFLFLPDDIAQKFGILERRAEFRPWVGLVFLIAASYLTALLAVRIWSGVEANSASRRRTRILRESLTKLTKHEKWYLRPYVVDGENTTYHSIEDGIVNGLVAKTILYRSASIGDMINGFAFNIQPWALDHLRQNPGLLEGAKEPPNRDPY